MLALIMVNGLNIVQNITHPRIILCRRDGEAKILSISFIHLSLSGRDHFVSKFIHGSFALELTQCAQWVLLLMS